MRLIRVLIALTVSSTFIHAQTWIKVDDNTAFRYIKRNEKGRVIKPQMVMLVDLLGYGKKIANPEADTILFNSVSSDKPYYIPTEQPGLNKVFYQLNTGDSIEIRVIADTFYNKTFSSPLPAFVPPGSFVQLFFHIQEAFTFAEIEQKSKEQNKVTIKADSIKLSNYCKRIKGVLSTKNGLRYKLLKANPTGQKVIQGNAVSVKYKGWLVDGDVFDSNETGEPFKFVVGMSQVIKGWDEGLKLMRVGETYRLIIPWYLAYGTHGTGPIPPYSSLVFDVQVLNIN